MSNLEVSFFNQREQTPESYTRNDLIQYVSAPCGSGKTYAICTEIADTIDSSNHLYVAPTLKLLEETRTLLEKLNVSCRLITSQSHPANVKKEILSFLKVCEEVGQVLLITFNAYIELPYFHNRTNWSVYIDETPQLDFLNSFNITVPRHKQLFVDLLEAEQFCEGLLKVNPKSKSEIMDLLKYKNDQLLSQFKDLLWKLVSANFDTYIDEKSWYELNSDDDSEMQMKSRKHNVYFLSLLTPAAFQGATLVAANFDFSLFYVWFGMNGEKFKGNENIYRRLRPSKLPGNRVSIKYFVPSVRYSKYLGAKDLDGVSLRVLMDELALNEFGNQPFLYVTNKDRPKPNTPPWANAVEISTAVHGLNEYASFDKLYYGASTNREPRHFRMLNHLGLDSEVIHRATADEIIYQCLLRTSLRDEKCSQKVVALVPDELSARRIAKLIGANDVSQLGSLMQPKLTALTSSEKCRRARAKKVMQQLFGSNLIPTSIAAQEEGIRFDAIEADSAGNPSNVIVTYHKHIEANAPNDHVVRINTVREFVNLLRSCHLNVIDDKRDNLYFNSALFECNELDQGYRKQSFFVQSSLLILDFDGGTLSPDKFEELFYDKGGAGFKTSFIICNTYSRTATNPNKFRVIFFLKTPVRSIKAHQDIFDAVVEKIQSAGYSALDAALDPMCRSGVQSFLLPCTNRRNVDSAFFRCYGLQANQLRKFAIDPTLIQPVPKVEIVSLDHGDRNLTTEAIAKATAKISGMKSGRNLEFFKTGVHLARLGMNRSEVEAELYRIASSEMKMRRKVPGILKTLDKYGWKSSSTKS